MKFFQIELLKNFHSNLLKSSESFPCTSSFYFFTLNVLEHRNEIFQPKSKNFITALVFVFSFGSPLWNPCQVVFLFLLDYFLLLTLQQF